MATWRPTHSLPWRFFASTVSRCCFSDLRIRVDQVQWLRTRRAPSLEASLCWRRWVRRFTIMIHRPHRLLRIPIPKSQLLQQLKSRYTDYSAGKSQFILFSAVESVWKPLSLSLIRSVHWCLKDLDQISEICDVLVCIVFDFVIWNIMMGMWYLKS